jgi:uncharacterized protein (TIGR00369 family)
MPETVQQIRNRVVESFQRQAVMVNFGAEIAFVEPGFVQIRMPFRPDLTQQHGYLHAGVLTTICDSACGFAAFSRMPPTSQVLTVEFKMNFLAPAQADYFVAVGRVIKAGRTLIVCEGNITAYHKEEDTLIAVMQATMMALPPAY